MLNESSEHSVDSYSRGLSSGDKQDSSNSVALVMLSTTLRNHLTVTMNSVWMLCSCQVAAKQERRPCKRWSRRFVRLRLA